MARMIKRAESQGWSVQCTKNGHIKWTSPDGQTVIGGTAHSKDHEHYYERTEKYLARAGLD